MGGVAGCCDVQSVVKLDALLREKNIPMVVVRAYGLVGAVRVSVEVTYPPHTQATSGKGPMK